MSSSRGIWKTFKRPVQYVCRVGSVFAVREAGCRLQRGGEEGVVRAG